MPDCEFAEATLRREKRPLLHLPTEHLVTLALPRVSGVKIQYEGCRCAEPEGECWARAGPAEGPRRPNTCPSDTLTQAGAGAPAPCPRIPRAGNTVEKPPFRATAVERQGRRTSRLLSGVVRQKMRKGLQLRGRGLSVI